MTTIHPTALVDAQAVLGRNVRVGAYVIIDAGASVADGCTIDPYSHIHGHSTIGANCHIASHCSIGALPQDLGFMSVTKSGLIIEAGCVVREMTTIHRAKIAGANTHIKANCYIMTGVHIGHDSVVGENCIITSNAALGGHTLLDNNCYISPGAMFHQFSRVGAYALVPAGARIRKDVLPFCMLAERAGSLLHLSLHKVGMARAGIAGDQLQLLKKAIFGYLKNRIPVEQWDLPASNQLTYLKNWLAATSRSGHYGFVKPRKNN